MKAEIISVGTELILGSTLNTNTYYITQKLSEAGIDVLFHTSVVDDRKLLKSIINISLNRVDLIILTGGLGPTTDDLTKEVVADTLGLYLKLNYDLENDIKKYFQKSNRAMPSNNIKQAYIPEGSRFLKNEIGTAPGIYIKYQDKIIILLPGPPKEMKLMLDNYAMPLIKQDNITIVKTINTIGIGESQLEMILRDIDIESENSTIATYAKEGRVDIKVVSKGKNKEKIEKELAEIIFQIENKIPEFIYSYDDIPIEEIVYKKLKDRNMQIAFCESCTGGLIASRFTQISGVSEVFDRGIISYSNNSKVEELGVEEALINKFGAVSEEVALAMAEGLLNKCNVDIALSTTGIAGPTGGTEDKPVGLVFIGIALNDRSFVIKSIFNGDRISIQNRATFKAFDELRKIL